MGREFEISLDGIRDGISEIFDEIRQDIETQQDEIVNNLYVQRQAGKTPVKVGYEDKLFYLGIFCDESSITQEQIDILENLNGKILIRLNYIFAQTDKLTCTYNALKKYLPELTDEDIVNVEKIKQEIKDKSKANYLSEIRLSEELKNMYRLLRYINFYDKENIINLYDYETVKLEYRKLHLLYRCYKVVKEWQNERLKIYMGWGNQQKIELITDEQFELIRDMLHEFKVETKKYHTSELVKLVLDADKTGQLDSDKLKRIINVISE